MVDTVEKSVTTQVVFCFAQNNTWNCWIDQESDMPNPTFPNVESANFSDAFRHDGNNIELFLNKKGDHAGPMMGIEKRMMNCTLYSDGYIHRYADANEDRDRITREAKRTLVCK